MCNRRRIPALLAALLVPWLSAMAGSPKPASNAQEIAAGHELFNDNCEHCHGPDAVEGVEQRNLRHLYQRYGGKMDQVFMVTVTHGRVTKGMPNWSGILNQAQLRQILAFLHSVQAR
jgi:polar amino acid transport system substrate-binding protein